MKIFTKEFWGFKQKASEDKFVSILEALPMHKEQARVIPLVNKEQEFEDLEENHKEFFDTSLSPTEQLQPNLGRKSTNHILANIADVNPSRSTRFFQNAPDVANEHQPDFKSDSDVSRDFERLEQYMGVEIHEDTDKN